MKLALKSIIWTLQCRGNTILLILYNYLSVHDKSVGKDLTINGSFFFFLKKP